MFKALEELTKLQGQYSRLNDKSINNVFKTKISYVYQDNKALEAANNYMESFKKWVVANHSYRHAAGDPAAKECPVSLATAIIDSGSSHLRWLVYLCYGSKEKIR